MVAGFKRIFDMSTFQASLVQLAYFGAYFLLALPAAFINQRFGYKTGILTGLALAALGAFLFYPASKIMTYEAFLVALFAMAAGCSILETSANPYRHVARPGEHGDAAVEPRPGVQSGRHEHRRAARLDADPAQARRSGRHRVAHAGPAAHDPGGRARRGDGSLPRPRVPADPDRRSPSRARRRRRSSRSSRTPARTRAARASCSACCGATSATASASSPSSSNVAAQVCTWTFLIQYVEQALGGSLEKGGFYLQVEPVGLPRVALPHDLGDRLHPRDQGARGARVPGRGAVPVRDGRARTWPGCSPSSRCRSACR